MLAEYMQSVDCWLDDDEISPEEAAFILGYIEE